jgi:hypothetical protein
LAKVDLSGHVGKVDERISIPLNFLDGGVAVLLVKRNGVSLVPLKQSLDVAKVVSVDHTRIAK